MLQVTQMLGVYHAELARILHLQCSDIGDLANTENVISINSTSWAQAENYIELYEYLYVLFDGDEPLMNNGLRKKNKILDAVLDVLKVNLSKTEK